MEFIIWVIAYLTVNAISALVVAYVAESKGRSAVGFFWLSFFLTFLVGILVVLALPNLKTNSVVVNDSGRFGFKESERVFKCPYCAEWVKAEAKICRFCSKDISKDISRLSAKDLKAQEAKQLAQAENYEKAKKEAKKAGIRFILTILSIPVTILLFDFFFLGYL